MSTYARMRKMRISAFKPYSESSEYIADAKVFIIHDVPEKIEYGDEFDFWIMDGRDCYFLRIEKSKENKVYFIRNKSKDPLYCIMKIDVIKIDISEQLALLKRVGIPYRLKGHINIELHDKIWSNCKLFSIKFSEITPH